MADVRILAEVSADVADAANWYDHKGGYAGLGEKFESTFYSYVEHVQERGQIYRTVYSGFRRIFLRPFSVCAILPLPRRAACRLLGHPRRQ